MDPFPLPRLCSHPSLSHSSIDHGGWESGHNQVPHQAQITVTWTMFLLQEFSTWKSSYVSPDQGNMVRQLQGSRMVPRDDYNSLTSDIFGPFYSISDHLYTIFLMHCMDVQSN